MSSGFILATSLLLLLRLACAPFDPLPGEARFLPPSLFGTVCVVLLGPAAVWAAAVASLLGDLVAGQWSSVAWFRAAGEAVAAMHVFALWDSSFFRRQTALALAPTRRQAARFAALAVPAGFIAASWNALGVEISGNQPFGYAALLEAGQTAVFGLILSPALFFAAAGDIASHLGDWRRLAGQSACWSHWRPAGLIAGCLAAVFILPFALLQGIVVTGELPWNTLSPGSSTGGGLAELIAGLLAFHLVVVFWPD